MTFVVSATRDGGTIEIPYSNSWAAMQAKNALDRKGYVAMVVLVFPRTVKGVWS